MKAIFQNPEDEASWQNLEKLRGVVCAMLEAETEVVMQVPEELEALISALKE